MIPRRIGKSRDQRKSAKMDQNNKSRNRPRKSPKREEQAAETSKNEIEEQKRCIGSGIMGPRPGRSGVSDFLLYRYIRKFFTRHILTHAAYMIDPFCCGIDL